MNRKQKIIISVTGIFIVLLILVGLTYAYFLTRIQGNTNSKSISVTTADLKLTYGDGTNQILSSDTKLIPSNDAIGVKDFTVTNEGDDTSYVVVIEDVKILKASDGTTTTFNSNDFRYTLTCTKSDGSSCDGVSTQTVLPLTKGVLVGNSITAGDVHTYKLTVWYIETNTDQSEDMGKTLEAKVNITNMESVNPYSANTNSLAYNIIENARTKANGTELLASPKTKVAEEISQYGTGNFEYETVTFTSDLLPGMWKVGDSEISAKNGSNATTYDSAVGKYVYNIMDGSTKYFESYDASSSTGKFKIEKKYNETSVSLVADDYGTSYYYRGNVTDNYVNFAGMCWRIVRIAGDRSIKLILEDQDSTCATSDGNWNIPTTTGGTTKTGNFGYTFHEPNTLTASDGTQNSSVRYIMNYLNGATNNDKSMATVFKNFQTGPLANYLDKLKAGDWCLNDKAYASSSDNTTPLTSQVILNKHVELKSYSTKSFYYNSYVRLYGKTTKEPTLKCNGTVMTKFADEKNTDMYVGTLTADEIVYAGGKVYSDNKDYYLINDYQKSNGLNFWTLSPSAFSESKGTCGNISDGAFVVRQHTTTTSNYSIIDNGLGSVSVAQSCSMDNIDVSFRPSINLKSGIEITGGNGTKANPYVVS